VFASTETKGQLQYTEITSNGFSSHGTQALTVAGIFLKFWRWCEQHRTKRTSADAETEIEKDTDRNNEAKGAQTKEY
jgi:hypothetical protein